MVDAFSDSARQENRTEVTSKWFNLYRSLVPLTPCCSMWPLTSQVDTISRLIIKKAGFPFDKDFDREASFHNHLDDIAKRHPELAGHFEGFPFRSNSWSRRHPEESDTFRRFTNRDRPFGSRFEQFGFPFRDNKFAQQDKQDSHPNQQEQSHSSQEHTQNIHSEKESEDPSQISPQVTERGRKPYSIHSSNTADLEHKQEPVNERSQRSMSAPPPENRSPRYTSSITIPIQRETGGVEAGTECHSQSQGHAAQAQQMTKPTERVIPIHVEGRDEPVIPKNVHQTFSQPTSHSFPQHPEPEHIFGNRHNLGDFMGCNATRFPGRDDAYKWQHEVPHEQVFQQQMPKQSCPKPQKTPKPEQASQEKQTASHVSQQNTQQEHPVPPQTAKLTPIEQIKAIQKDVSELMTQVEQFSGVPKDKQYLYLDEMLTRNLIKLDNIDTQGQENIRSARREAIKCIEKCIQVLESKANANLAAKSENVGVDVNLKHEGEMKECNLENQGIVELQPMETDSNDAVNKEQVTNVEPMELVAEESLQAVQEEKESKETSEKQAISNVSNSQEGQNVVELDTVKSQEEPRKLEESEIDNQNVDTKMELDDKSLNPSSDGPSSLAEPSDPSPAKSDSSSHKSSDSSLQPLEQQKEVKSELPGQYKEEVKEEKKEKKKGKKKEKSEKK